MQPEDYIFIKWWGKRLGSNYSYIKQEQELALDEKAPVTAIYSRSRGGWNTIHDIVNPLALAELERDFGSDVFERYVSD